MIYIKFLNNWNYIGRPYLKNKTTNNKTHKTDNKQTNQTKQNQQIFITAWFETSSLQSKHLGI